MIGGASQVDITQYGSLSDMNEGIWHESIYQLKYEETQICFKRMLYRSGKQMTFKEKSDSKNYYQARKRIWSVASRFEAMA